MRLEKFRVVNFRSIEDSNHIETKDITSLIGENESGKTNVLLPLWKLNPTTQRMDSSLDLIKDYPRKDYRLIHSAERNSELKKRDFVIAQFSLEPNDKELIKNNFSINVDTIEASRDYNDRFKIKLFYKDENILDKLCDSIVKDSLSFSKKISDQSQYISELTKLIQAFSDKKDESTAMALKNKIVVENENLPTNLIDNLDTYIIIIKDISNQTLSTIKNMIPKFIYYSDYGNLNSKIYMPDVINKTEKNSAKTRTLETLFEFVNLSPSEIYEMGHLSQNPSEDEKKKRQEKINERQILLDSASTSFTRSFNEWWGQGNYSFKFEVDGDYFSIKVSDSIRKEPIELEQRSRGLQWFFSFYLVFLVEKCKAHKNAILLLDEPGVTLHPNAQKDLYLFFENLASENQLIYTTHSPFMINPNQLDKVYAVYISDAGYSEITSDLRHTTSKQQNNSIYPAFAALGLNVSDTLLRGCIPVIVEGISDQIYFSTIKNALINKDIIHTNKEIVFVPSTGVKGIKSILTLLSCIESNEFPFIIVDGDNAGKELQKSLLNDLYKGLDDKVLSISDYKDEYEVEDLMPREELIKVISSYLPKKENVDDEFEDIVEKDKPICNEIKKYCKQNNIELSKGYKVDIAKKLKDKLLKRNINIYDKMSIDQQHFISELFKKIIG